MLFNEWAWFKVISLLIKPESALGFVFGARTQTERKKRCIMVTMNKLCVRLFIIIFMMYNCKSEYIPAVTNFVSILANCFIFCGR